MRERPKAEDEEGPAARASLGMGLLDDELEEPNAGDDGGVGKC